MRPENGKRLFRSWIIPNPVEQFSESSRKRAKRVIPDLRSRVCAAAFHVAARTGRRQHAVNCSTGCGIRLCLSGMTMFGWLCAALFLAFALQAPAMAAVANLIEGGASENSLFIEPSYDGTSVALFGSVDVGRLDGQPFDIAVTLRGPNQPVTVWKKKRQAGLWVNAESLAFEGAPNYYAVLSTKPVKELAPLQERAAHQIGIDALSLPVQERKTGIRSAGGIRGCADRIEKEEKPFHRERPRRNRVFRRQTFPREGVPAPRRRSRTLQGGVFRPSKWQSHRTGEREDPAEEDRRRGAAFIGGGGSPLALRPAGGDAGRRFRRRRLACIPSLTRSRRRDLP